jgi:Family of unknown function (DUF6056)
MTFSFYHSITSLLTTLVNKKYFWWTMFLLVLSPLLILVFFNHPSADDYFYVVDVSNRGFFVAQKFSYFHWSGRYVSTFLLSSSPLASGSFFGYKLVALTLLLLTAFVILFFVKTLMNKKVPVVAVSTCVLFLYVVKMPSLTEGFYWMAGAVTYQLGNVAALTVITLALHMKQQYSHWKLVAATMLCIMACGANETTMLEFSYVLTALMVFEYASTRKIPTYYFVLFTVTAIAGSIIVLAPGNAMRASSFQGEKNIIKALSLALDSGVMRMKDWLQDAFILLILFLPFIKQVVVMTPEQRKITPLILFLYPLFIMGVAIIGFFPAFWSLGFEPPTRTVNVLYWFFLAACLHYIILWVVYVRQNNTSLLSVPLYVQCLLVFIAFVHLAPANNLRTATMDIVSGRAATYDREMEERYVQLMNNKGEAVTCKPISVIPKSIFFIDIEPEHPEDWKNRFTAAYFGLKSLNMTK